MKKRNLFGRRFLDLKVNLKAELREKKTKNRMKYIKMKKQSRICQIKHLYCLCSLFKAQFQIRMSPN